MDGYYEYIWDTTMLEFIINLHTKRGETAKKNIAVRDHNEQLIDTCTNDLLYHTVQ